MPWLFHKRTESLFLCSERGIAQQYSLATFGTQRSWTVRRSGSNPDINKNAYESDYEQSLVVALFL